VTQDVSIALRYGNLHGNHAESGGLARTIGSQQAEDFSFLDAKGILADGLDLSSRVSLANVNNLNLILIVLLQSSAVLDLLGMLSHIVTDF
jgi:hypothetical protein